MYVHWRCLHQSVTARRHTCAKVYMFPEVLSTANLGTGEYFRSLQSTIRASLCAAAIPLQQLKVRELRSVCARRAAENPARRRTW